MGISERMNSLKICQVPIRFPSLRSGQIIGNSIDCLSAHLKPGPAVASDSGPYRRFPIMEDSYDRIRAVRAGNGPQVRFAFSCDNIINRGKSDAGLRIIRCGRRTAFIIQIRCQVTGDSV